MGLPKLWTYKKELLSNETKVLRLENVKYNTSGLDILKGISLVVEPGEIHAIAGESGAGKTTTLKLIAGIISPNSGDIFWGDTKTNKTWHKFRPFSVSIDNKNLNIRKSVYDNFVIALGENNETQINNILKKVGLFKASNKLVSSLSNGEKLRLSVTCAVIAKKQLIILDEPFANLQTELKKQMREFIKQNIKATGKSCIIVTHNFAQASSIADKISILEHGKITQTGTALDIAKNPKTLFCADFVGLSNKIKASIVALSENGGALLDIGGINIPVIVDKDLKIGQSVLFCIKSNQVAYGKTPRKNVYLNGVVKKYEMQNGIPSCTITLPNKIDIIANIQPSSEVEIKVGTRVFVWWNSEDVIVI